MGGPRHDRLEGSPYRTLSVLGSGSMGQVVLAEHRALSKVVCAKLLHAGLGDDKGIADRFRIEAQALARLGGGEHPHLVHVRDFGETPGGQLYFVMERLEGRTLQDERRARGAIPWRQAVRWTLEILDGISVAHEAGIVHRDLKPANIFVCGPAARAGGPDDDRTVKVLDFGIAKIVRGDGPVAPAADPTATAMMMCTPRYASPEQVKAERVDARTDLYSLGLMLHELVTGRVPYETRRREDAVCYAQLMERMPRASSLAKQVLPSALDEILERAHAKERSERFSSAKEMAAALRELVSAPATAPLPLQPSATEQMPLRPRAEPPRSPDAEPTVLAATVAAPTRVYQRGSGAGDPTVLSGARGRPARIARLATFVALTILSALAFGALGLWLWGRVRG